MYLIWATNASPFNARDGTTDTSAKVPHDLRYHPRDVLLIAHRRLRA